MSLLDRLIGLLAPHSCVSCGAEGRVLCETCQARLPAAASRCYHCLRPAAGGRTCADCLADSPLSCVASSALYVGPARLAVRRLKFEAARAAAADLAAAMLPLVGDKQGFLLVPVPTASSRRRQRGYDQAYLLARQLSRVSGLAFCPALARHGQTRQVRAGRAQRRLQLTDAYRLRRSAAVTGRRILLIDDVITTGATLEAAARTLAAAGAAQIEAVTFAQA